MISSAMAKSTTDLVFTSTFKTVIPFSRRAHNPISKILTRQSLLSRGIGICSDESNCYDHKFNIQHLFIEPLLRIT